MSFLEEILQGGAGYVVEQRAGGASFRPASGSDEDLEAFQQIVRQLQGNSGDGYIVTITHPLSTRGGKIIDLVMIETAK